VYQVECAHSRLCRTLVVIAAVAVLSAAILIGSCAKRWAHLEPSKMTPGIFLDSERAILPPGFVPGNPTILPPGWRGLPDEGLTLTEASEGFVPDLYDDASGNCSIAFGHLIKRARCDGSEPIEFQDGLSKATGAELLVRDMLLAQAEVQQEVTAKLSDGEYAALCDFVYNVGGTNFRKSTLRKVINNNELERVPGQFRRWVLAGGRPWSGLRTRRNNEIALFFDGLPLPRALPPAGEDLSVIDIRTGEQ
jgi:lysozyme